MCATRRKKKTGRRVLYISICLAGLFISWLLFQWFLYGNNKFVRYPAFNVDVPTSYSIHGIDVSRYQERINWEEVQMMRVEDIAVRFAFIKATEGLNNLDPQFRRNWRLAKKNNIPRGAYHFFLPTKDGKMQAESFIKKVGLEPGDLPPVLDIEQLYGVSPERMRTEINKWLLTVEKYYGVRPVIYTYVDFYNKYLGKDYDIYPLWVAHYYKNNKPRISRDWNFWQFSDAATINGIGARVDFNVFNGDTLDFKKLLLK